jgi:3-phenylpropionate/trans-cinnamate dioxygenase ferredoxin subunit
VSTIHHLGPLNQFAADSVRRLEIDGRSIAFVRIGDDVYAIGDRCSHADVSLSAGELWCDERQLECPKHGSRFDLTTGEPLTLPATQPVPVYDVRVVNGEVELEVS